jgi:molybdenum cofactor cytidylyltransferase
MLSSVQHGVAALPFRASGALIWPVDVPWVRAETVRALLDAPSAQIVIPTWQGRGGHPLRLPRALFGEVALLDPADGLRALLAARAPRVHRMEVPDPAVVRDVDTPEDLKA